MADANTETTCSHTKKRPKKTICAAWGCNNYQNVNANVSFFKFPRDDERCKRWVSKLKRADLDKFDATQLRHRVVCEKHFDPRDFTKATKR